MIDFAKNGNRPVRVILGFFTLVGFLASLVTIIQFFKTTEASSLHVTVSQHKFQIPYYSGKALQDRKPGRLLSEDLRSTLCERFSDDQVLKTAYDEIPQVFKDDSVKAADCKKAQDVEFASRWAGEYSDTDAALYEYQIKNAGNKPATGLRLSSSGMNTAQYSHDSVKYVELKSKEGEGYYSLPTVNPGESLKVLAWSSTAFYDTPYREWDDLPAITYSGSDIHTEFLRPVPDGWYNAYDFFVEMPWIFILLFLFAGAFAIVFVFVGIIGLIQALVTGKPLSEIFDNKNGEVKLIEANESSET